MVCVCALVLNNSFGQVNSINFSTKDGLPSPETYLVHEDRDGFIWICTDRGLSRYNGYEFENFSTKDGLSYNTVFDIFEDEDRNLWITAFDGSITIYDIENRTFTPFKYNEKLLEISYNRKILGIGFTHEYIDIFSGFSLTEARTVRHSLLDSSLVEIMIAIDSELKYNNLSIKEGTIVGTNEVTFGFIGRSQEKTSNTLNTPTQLLRYKTVKPYEQEVLLFDDTGIIVINNSGEQHYNIENVSSFMRDRTGNYWVSTLSTGIHLIPSFDFELIPKKSIIDPAVGDKLNDILAVDNDLLIGTRKGEILVYEFATSTIKKIASVKQEVLEFSEVRNRIYASFGYEVNIKQKEIVWHPEFDQMKSLRPYNDGFIGYGFSQKFDVFDSNENLQSSIRLKTVEESARILSICPINDSESYFSTFSGLFKINKDQSIETISEEYKIENFTIREIINPLPNLYLFSSTGDGLVVKYRDSISIITTNEGLTSNFINDVISIDNVIWCATNVGISRIEFQLADNLNFEIINLTNYSLTEGVGSSYLAKLQYNEEKIFALTNDGIIFFDKNITVSTNLSPTVNIEGIQQGRVLRKSGYEFEYDENRLEIKYLSMSTRKNRAGRFYRYKLLRNKKDNEWTYTDNRSAVFNDLAAGKYEFLIECKVINGTWSPTSMINFEIKPYFFYQTWVLVVGILLLGILGYVLYKIDVTRRKNRYKESLKLANATSRLHKLELEVLRGQMNPHFIYNALNSAQKFLLKDDKVGANRFISRLAKMLRSGLLYSRSESISIEEEIEFLDNYLKIETQRFPNRFSYEIEVAPDLDFVQLPPLLIQPLCENAIKHAYRDKKVHIKIDIQEYTNKTLIVLITDTGFGYLNNNLKDIRKESLGIDILKRRLNVFTDKEYDVSCSFLYLDEKAKTGTKIKLIIPIIE